MNRKIKKYGWIPDLPDQRDHLYSAPQPVLAKLPKKIDLRRKCPPVFNQRNLNIPSPLQGEGQGGGRDWNLSTRSMTKEFTLSRLFIYYNRRARNGGHRPRRRQHNDQDDHQTLVRTRRSTRNRLALRH